MSEHDGDEFSAWFDENCSQLLAGMKWASNEDRNRVENACMEAFYAGQEALQTRLRILLGLDKE